MSDRPNALPDYSVSMSVYAGEKPEFLKLSLDSMLSQTHPCKELILVCDGRLGDKLDELINEYEKQYKNIIKVIRFGSPRGVGGCANAALKAAESGYIVKMDSDDIACPDRCQRQLSLFAADPDLDMCGAFIEEFDSQSNERLSIKRTPVTHEEIMRYAKRRNPFNNPTLVYKRSKALEVGGYSKIKRCEDYDFVVKMLANGAKGENIPEVLVRYRVTADNLSRRKNAYNTRSFIAVRWKIFRSGFSSFSDFLIPCLAQITLFILPSSLTGKLYKKFLRN